MLWGTDRSTCGAAVIMDGTSTSAELPDRQHLHPIINPKSKPPPTGGGGFQVMLTPPRWDFPIQSHAHLCMWLLLG